jgi:hypothetical protein
MYSFLVYVSGECSKTKTIIQIQGNKKLSDLADAICASKLSDIIDELNDDSHLYGFTDNLKSFWRDSKSGIKYTKQPDNEMQEFRHMFFCIKTDREVAASKINISGKFNLVGKKMLFAYDFGTTTNFIIRRIS